jgi:hypothetical protein
LGDRPITIENNPRVRAPLAVRPLRGIDDPPMMLRCAVRKFDRGRHIDELRGIPGVGQPRAGERDERVQAIGRRVHRRCVLEEPDPAFDLVKFGPPMAHERGRDRA